MRPEHSFIVVAPTEGRWEVWPEGPSAAGQAQAASQESIRKAKKLHEPQVGIWVVGKSMVLFWVPQILGAVLC